MVLPVIITIITILLQAGTSRARVRGDSRTKWDWSWLARRKKIQVSAYEISEQSCSMANPRFSMNFMILAGTPHKISWFQSFFSRQSNGYCDYQVKQPNGLCTLGKDRPEICPDFVKETLLLRLSTCEPGMHVSQALAAFSSWLHDVPCVLQLHGAHLPRWVLNCTATDHILQTWHREQAGHSPKSGTTGAWKLKQFTLCTAKHRVGLRDSSTGKWCSLDLGRPQFRVLLMGLLYNIYIYVYIYICVYIYIWSNDV